MLHTRFWYFNVSLHLRPMWARFLPKLYLNPFFLNTLCSFVSVLSFIWFFCLLQCLNLLFLFFQNFCPCPNCLSDRWKECRSDSSHSCLRRECAGHKQRIIPQGFCEGRRKVNLAPRHVIYILFLSCSFWDCCCCLYGPVSLGRKWLLSSLLDISNRF